MIKTIYKSILLTFFFVLNANAIDINNMAIYDLPCITHIPWCNVYVFFRDSEGYMWYSTEEGLFRDNGYQTDIFRSNDENPKLMRSNNIFDIAEDGNGHIWFCTYQGAYILDKKDYNIHEIQQKELKGQTIEAIYKVSDGSIWLSSGSWIMHFDANENILEKIDLSKYIDKAGSVSSFYEDSQNVLWIIQRNERMWRYDTKKKCFIPYSWDVNIDPQCIIEDSNHGCYWIATWGHGVVKCIPNKVGNNAITELQPSTMSGDYDGVEFTLDIDLDIKDNILWVTSKAGVLAYQFDENGNLKPSFITKLLPKGKYYFRNITRDIFDNLWISGASKKVCMLPRINDGIRRYYKRWENLTVNDSLLNEVKKTIPEALMAKKDSHGNLFYQTQKDGLCVMREGENKPETIMNEDDVCSCMTMNEDGTLWIGTNIGRVFSFKYKTDKEPQYVPQLSNEAGQRILDIEKDHKGHIWSLTRESVKEWDKKSEHSRTLFCHHPMIHLDHFNALECWEKDSMCVWEEEGFCTIASFDFDNNVNDTVKTQVSTVIIDNKKNYVAPGMQEIEIPCNANIVELRLTTFQQHLTNQVQFAYRLIKKGLLSDKYTDWTELPIGNNTVVMTSPSKGDYSLEVKATNGQGIWNEPYQIFTLHKLPYWWESWWAYSLYTLCILSVIGLAFRQYSIYVRRKRMTQMEEQLTEMKFKFFTNVSHELRTPLTLIRVPIEQMLSASDKMSERDKQKLQGIQRNAQELEQLINQLLDFRRMEMGTQKLSTHNGNITEFITAAVNAFKPLAQRKNIALNFDHPEKDIYATFDHEKMHHIIWNLLSNAMKFTPEGGKVNVELKMLEEDKNKISVHVIDNGVGIPAKDLPHIFDLYFQSANSSSQGGSGIGLHMVQQLVQLHGGEVGVKSLEGKGTDFWFNIPIMCNPEKQTEHKKDHDTDDETSNDTEEATEDNTVLKTEDDIVLVVEDNPEMRELVSDQLRDEGYNIQEAGNGEEAWNILTNNDNISLIVSDVMMPIMDGFELCKKVKSTEKTSHIPVILLTAKTSDESRMEGYKMGADYYLTKPFSTAELLDRIKYLQKQRASMKQKFQHDEENEVAQLTYSPIDEELITRAQKIVESHLSDKEYNVDKFSSDMCASRMTLYRKIHSITGQSPSEFITTIRLKHAANLLRTTTLTTFYISEQTGFSSPSYFTKHFKKMFGMLPKEYRNKGR